MRLAWASDIHLDHLQSAAEFDAFTTKVNAFEPDVLLVTGDISNSHFLHRHLAKLDRQVWAEIFFVLGNHDFYFSSQRAVRERLKKFLASNSDAHYLTTRNYVKLTEQTALVGHDGWYDGRAGLGAASRFTMTDWNEIHDYQGARWGGYRYNMDALVKISQGFADEATGEILKKTEAAIKDGFQHILIATHMPPWEEAHLHEGRGGTPDALPWYTNQLLGRMLKRVADENPTTSFTVLAGHTHGECSVGIADNLVCKVAASDYGAPRVSEVFDL